MIDLQFYPEKHGSILMRWRWWYPLCVVVDIHVRGDTKLYKGIKREMSETDYFHWSVMSLCVTGLFPHMNLEQHMHKCKSTMLWRKMCYSSNKLSGTEYSFQWLIFNFIRKNTDLFWWDDDGDIRFSLDQHTERYHQLCVGLEQSGYHQLCVLV
jgi:hypothetical protein